MAALKDGFRLRGEKFYVPLMDGSAHEVLITDTNFLKDE